jgi:hypothetical protein
MLVTVGLLLGLSPRTALAQGPWSVFVAGGAVGFGGASKAVEVVPGVPAQFKPTPTVLVRFGVERDFGKASGRVAFGYAQAGLGAYGGEGATVSLDPGASLYEVYLLAGYRLAQLHNGTRVTVRAGPLLQIWEGDFTLTTQYQWGGLGSLAIAAPLAPSLSLEAEGSMSLTGSPFVAENFASLPAQYATKSLWTRELSVGLRYSF